jgi:hypothetical protein
MTLTILAYSQVDNRLVIRWFVGSLIRLASLHDGIKFSIVEL